VRAAKNLIRNFALFKAHPKFSILSLPSSTEIESEQLVVGKFKLYLEQQKRKLAQNSNKSSVGRSASKMKLDLKKIKTPRMVLVENLIDPDQLKDFDLVIQTTPFGMSGHPLENQSILDKNFISKNHVIFDIVYNPQVTPLLKFAKQKKSNIILGEKMLLYQGVLQFEMFTGEEAPIEIMHNALQKELKKL